MERFDFIAIDFETANQDFNSACSIGIAAVRDSEIVETYYSLINSHVEFSPDNIRVHGITPEDVRRAPSAYDVWREISRFFGNYAVLAHNAYFDMSVLKKSFPFLNQVDFKYIDTVSLCKEFVPGRKSLAHCADFFHIDLGCHHNALDDAETCAKVALSCIQASGYKNLGELCFSLPSLRIFQFSDLDAPPSTKFQRDKKRPAYSGVRPQDFNRTVASSEINQDNPFFEKIVVFTGELGMSRADAVQAAVNLGASVRGSVARRTDYLVVGTQDKELVGESGMSTKERRAADYNEMGFAHIEIINEERFLSILRGEA